MMLPVRSNAPSSVSVSHYDDELARRQSKTHVAFLYTASKGDRQKREAASGSNSVELVSLGPLLLGHDTQLEDTPSVKQNASTSQHGIKIQFGIFGSQSVSVAVFRVVVYVLSAIGAMGLVILVLTAWSNIRKKPESQSSWLNTHNFNKLTCIYSSLSSSDLPTNSV